MKILFFFVHPSKFYLFRKTIDDLYSEGHSVQVLIINKDVLVDLVSQTNWYYKVILNTNRRTKFERFKRLFTAFYALLTILVLLRAVGFKRHDLFVTDDLLVVLGRLLKIPTLFFTDDDLAVVPENSFFYSRATSIISPIWTNLGKYDSKKLAMIGFKELAYLHPDIFVPDRDLCVKSVGKEKYVLIRVVSLSATHDTGIKGLDNKLLHEIINRVKKKYNVFISSERILPEELNQYVIKINPIDIAHYLSFSEFFITDSQTMASEAAVLGVPTIRYNSFVGKISVMEIKEEKYGLYFGVKPDNSVRLLELVEYLLENENLKEEWAKRKSKMLSECEDVNNFMINTIKKYA